MHGTARRAPHISRQINFKKNFILLLPPIVICSSAHYNAIGTVRFPPDRGYRGYRQHPLPVGNFYVRSGAIVTPSVEQTDILGTQENLDSVQDICYNDDLIVDGSLCVGFDCVCNHSFGFDTIVLKENNLRIFFDDTSVAGSYPRNDWRILINDTTNGGAEYFGVEDSTSGRRVFTLEARPPAHSLYVDDGGRVGLGTSTPLVELHVKNGDTPTIRLEQDGTSGFTPQTFDVAGNETSFFIRDVTNGSTLPFRIQPGAPNNAFTIRADGSVGHGTWAPSFRFHQLTNSSTNAQLVAERTSGARTLLSATNTAGFIGTLNDFPMRITVNNQQRMQLNNDNSVSMNNGASLTAGGIWTDASSKEYKENITQLDSAEAVAALNELNPVSYNYKADTREKHLGFIAEDVPQLVAMNDRKGLAPMEITALLTKVVQKQQEEMKLHKALIEKLQKEIAQLKKDSR